MFFKSRYPLKEVDDNAERYLFGIGHLRVQCCHVSVRHPLKHEV